MRGDQTTKKLMSAKVKLLVVIGALPRLAYPFFQLGFLFWLVSFGNCTGGRNLAVLVAAIAQISPFLYPLVTELSTSAEWPETNVRN